MSLAKCALRRKRIPTFPVGRVFVAFSSTGKFEPQDPSGESFATFPSDGYVHVDHGSGYEWVPWQKRILDLGSRIVNVGEIRDVTIVWWFVVTVDPSAKSLRDL